jgi:hypothetical protein
MCRQRGRPVPTSPFSDQPAERGAALDDGDAGSPGAIKAQACSRRRHSRVAVSRPGGGELMHDEPQPLFAKRRSSDDHVVLELGGDRDASTLDELNEVLREVLAEQPNAVIVGLVQAPSSTR